MVMIRSDYRSFVHDVDLITQFYDAESNHLAMDHHHHGWLLYSYAHIYT